MNRRNMLLPPMRQRIARASSGDALEETAMTLSDDLNKLDELRARGALTDEECARAKERLLSSGTTGSGPPPPFASTVKTLPRTPPHPPLPRPSRQTRPVPPTNPPVS